MLFVSANFLQAQEIDEPYRSLGRERLMLPINCLSRVRLFKPIKFFFMFGNSASQINTIKLVKHQANVFGEKIRQTKIHKGCDVTCTQYTTNPWTNLCLATFILRRKDINSVVQGAIQDKCGRETKCKGTQIDEK